MAGSGTLEVHSSPPGARVYGDDAFISTTDPTFARLVVSDVDAGEHTLRLSAEGHDDVAKSVTITAERAAVYREQLPSRGISTLAIASGFAVIALVAVGLGLRRVSPTAGSESDPAATKSLEPKKEGEQPAKPP